MHSIDNISHEFVSAFVYLSISNLIKKYLIAFVALVLTSGFLPSIGGARYEEFSVNWLMVDHTVLATLPYIATLMLFVEVNNQSKQQVYADDIKS